MLGGFILGSCLRRVPGFRSIIQYPISMHVVFLPVATGVGHMQTQPVNAGLDSGTQLSFKGPMCHFLFFFNSRSPFAVIIEWIQLLMRNNYFEVLGLWLGLQSICNNLELGLSCCLVSVRIWKAFLKDLSFSLHVMTDPLGFNFSLSWVTQMFTFGAPIMHVRIYERLSEDSTDILGHKTMLIERETKEELAILF